MKKFIAWCLITFGYSLDLIPAWHHTNGVRRGRFYYGQYGCSSGYCGWAAQLDENWKTGIYQ